ncbi:DUF3618 domain-containing protein [Myxococcus sp. CA051A]|uniref:DUF3618 domain-containing protein n=1 Tax=Myxococcus llanfairpwllgwyngyllgogerychwyrndrobwllllantysiliogogogochensis TaxID=2590453 RepID=A0A540WKT6_9BACT|nr:MULTISPECIES: DUF3618 domain-containing protein [Myxococcus]NTX03982.1 DUF3618 domain-containing protein [Myxococcus sp. CA040A]NTX13406.1 DUF3618 domain-containing protein [Myxococcus sp. CA056]NTX35734.1 DUF3618 domain-containing protein [Myxococcus sp. CA033]NTX58649.1 DUF3618 domain-containing protein [Myxococcus sp. CA039A]NTX61864.1 DUF3618 domain-containing protein [Myxococcus sp. CA051A]
MGASNGHPKPVGPRTSAGLREDIERTRAELATSVSALREEVAVAADWREWVRRHPHECVAAAFAVGFLLGSRR